MVDFFSKPLFKSAKNQSRKEGSLEAPTNSNVLVRTIHLYSIHLYFFHSLLFLTPIPESPRTTTSFKYVK